MTEVKMQEQHVKMRSILEEHFQIYGIEIQDLFVDNKLTIRMGSSLHYIPDGQKYRVQIKIANSNFLFVTAAIDPKKDATKEKWYVIDKMDHKVGEWVDCNPSIFTGSLNHCTKKIIKCLNN